MKVMQVMPEFGMAGAEIMCENLLIGLKKIGIDVVVVSLYDFHSAITERLEANGIKIIYLGKKPGLDLKVFLKLFNTIKSENPDIIHTHRYVMEYVVPIARLLNKKNLIHTVHNIATKEQEKSKRILSKFFYHFCNVTPVALSAEVKETILIEYKLKKDEVPIVYNGEDLSRFHKKQSYTYDNKFRLLHIGRFMEAKNHLCLLNAINELIDEGYNLQLNCVGDYNSEIGSKCINFVKENQLDDIVIFSGLQADVVRFLDESDCFILPSIFEGMPMVLIEAMASGLPIIASCVGGIPDMLESNESGILINPTIKDIKNAIIKIINDADYRKKLGENAYNNSYMFDNDYMARKYSELYISKMTLNGAKIDE